MALTRLPTELLEIIITHVLPEGFESMAVTCKKIYAICIPFIQRHNDLRSRFDFFTYDESPNHPPPTIVSAGDLISYIAVEPLVARYVRSANLIYDTVRSCVIPRGLSGRVDCREDVIRLFANCPYLKQAGLDWREYLAKIGEELHRDRLPCYSQYAAAFLLTLLPNLERLTLPHYWKSFDATDKLIDAVVHKAKQSHSLCDRPSLARITRLEQCLSSMASDRVDLALATPFLALPRIRSFYGPSWVAMKDDYKSIALKDRPYGFGETLESVSFVACCVDEVGIADFLKDAKCLKRLTYSHSTKNDVPSRCWDICKFVAAIERHVGSHLVELSVCIWRPFGSIAPGKVSMRGFLSLRQLRFPLDIVMCNIAAAAGQVATLDRSSVGGSSHHKLDCDALFVGDLVPATISNLSLTSLGTDHHHKALNVMFRDFAAKKANTLPSLKQIHLSCLESADDAYKSCCTRLLAETQKTDVALYLDAWLHTGSPG